MPPYGGNEKDIAKGFARAMAYKERMLDAGATVVYMVSHNMGATDEEMLYCRNRLQRLLP